MESCKECQNWHPHEPSSGSRKRKCLVLQKRIVRQGIKTGVGKVPWRLTKTFPTEWCKKFKQR